MGNETRPTAHDAPLLCVLDLGPLLQARTDPTERVLAAAAALAPQGVMEIVAAPQPQALLEALGAAGYEAATLRSAAGVCVLRVARGRLPKFEDLTQAQPPLPLERVLQACAAMQPGEVYTAWLPRRPVLLLPHLDERGMQWQVQDHPDGGATLWVRKP